MNLIHSHLEQAPIFQAQDSIAIASIPIQFWEQPYEPSRGLIEGTIFPCLDKPFFAAEKKQGGELIG